MKYPEQSQYKYAKSRYRVRNWREYEVGLQRRGDLTVWLSDAALNSWRAPSDREQMMSSWSSQGVIAWLEPDSMNLQLGQPPASF